MCSVSGSRTMGVNQQGAADLNMTSLHGYTPPPPRHIAHCSSIIIVYIIYYLPLKMFAN